MRKFMFCFFISLLCLSTINTYAEERLPSYEVIGKTGSEKSFKQLGATQIASDTWEINYGDTSQVFWTIDNKIVSNAVVFHNMNTKDNIQREAVKSYLQNILDPGFIKERFTCDNKNTISCMLNKELVTYMTSNGVIEYPITIFDTIYRDVECMFGRTMVFSNFKENDFVYFCRLLTDQLANKYSK